MFYFCLGPFYIRLDSVDSSSFLTNVYSSHMYLHVKNFNPVCKLTLEGPFVSFFLLMFHQVSSFIKKDLFGSRDLGINFYDKHPPRSIRTDRRTTDTKNTSTQVFGLENKNCSHKRRSLLLSKKGPVTKNTVSPSTFRNTPPKVFTEFV